MAGDLLLTGLSGLNAFKNVLNTTSHNIANVQTEGYSRQRVELDARTPQFTGAGYIGTGVQTGAVTRQYDSFLTTQLRSSLAASSEFNSYFDLASQVDNLLINQDVGLSTALQDFFNAIQEVSDHPTSISARQVMLTEGDTIANRYNLLDTRLEEMSQQVNRDLTEIVGEVNRLAQAIADINEDIVSATGVASGSFPNDLLDERDLLINKLAEKVNVSTVEQSDGAVNVFIGNGQSLVLSNNANTLDLQPLGVDTSNLSVVFVQGSLSIDVTQFMTGGDIGGTLRFRDEILNPSIVSLGQSATAFSLAFNRLHTDGVDLNGAQGTEFFSIPQPTLLSSSTSVTVAFDPTVTDPTSSEYQLDVVDDGVNTAYTLTRLSDGTVTAGSFATAAVTKTFSVDGLVFDLGAVPANTTENYLIQPVTNGAKNIQLLTTTPQEIAAGLPVVADVPQTNAGSGNIRDIEVDGFVFDTLSPPLSADIVLTNTGPNTYNSSVGTVTYDAAADRYTLADPSFGTITFEVTGNVAVNDTFNIASNFGANFGVGDNRNANLLAGLQVAKNLSGGTATFQEDYGQLVADIGRRTQSAETSALAQEGLLNQTILKRDEVSGVNLDEEAANLVRFQQAYQASSQLIVVARTIFDTLINAFG